LPIRLEPLYGQPSAAGASVAYFLEQVPARKLPFDVSICLTFFGLALFWTAAGLALWAMI
jgi:hypothetical protein